MAKLFEKPYAEKKEHPIKMRVWRVLNATLFPIVTNRMRMRLLRWLGVKIENWLVTNPSTRIGGAPSQRAQAVTLHWNRDSIDTVCIGY